MRIVTGTWRLVSVFGLPLVHRRWVPHSATGMSGTFADAARRFAPDFSSLIVKERLIVASGKMPTTSPDRDVVHPPHERARVAVREDLLLRHEPHQALRRLRAEPGEDEVEVADVVARQHGPTFAGYVVRAVHGDPQVEQAEQELRGGDHRGIHAI